MDNTIKKLERLLNEAKERGTWGSVEIELKNGQPTVIRQTIQTKADEEIPNATAPASKPSKLFIPISAGLSDHMGDGRITPNMFCVYWAMLYGADYETGIWKGCAEKIRLYWNGSLEIRAIQRAMKSLSEGGYTKSFQKNGERGNYPVAINKYPVRFGVHKGKRLNAALMPDPSSPVYEDDPRQPKEKGVTSAAPPKPISQRSAKPQTQSYNDRVRSGVNNRDDDAEENAAIPVTSGDYKDNDRDSGAKNERDMSPTSEPTSVLHSIPEVPEVSEGLEVPIFWWRWGWWNKPIFAFFSQSNPLGQ